MKDLTFAVEAGSAGEDQVERIGAQYTAVSSQADALMEVASGNSDAAAIDALMAAAMIGEGTGYADLTYTISVIPFHTQSIDFPSSSSSLLSQSISTNSASTPILSANAFAMSASNPTHSPLSSL